MSANGSHLKQTPLQKVLYSDATELKMSHFVAVMFYRNCSVSGPQWHPAKETCTSAFQSFSIAFLQHAFCLAQNPS
jgi:hypothetical protein